MTADEAKETLEKMIQSQIYQRKYQRALQDQVADAYDKITVSQYKTVSDYLTQCYENGYIGTMYDIQGQGIPMMLPLNQEAMVMAIQLDSKISTGLYTKLGENVADLKKRIVSEVSRGISSGYTFEKIAQNLSSTTKIGYNNAIRIARTEGHRVQQQSSMNACHDAKDMGADIVKQWDSTLDNNTRASHRHVDGEIKELDEPFSNGLMFPGDPDGEAKEVINCRCQLLERARWALDDEELAELEERAKFWGLDKTATFDEYKQKYLNATAAAPVKKTYLTKKKLEELIKTDKGQIDYINQQFHDITGYSYDDIIKHWGSVDDYASIYSSTQESKLLKQLTSQKEALEKTVLDYQAKLDAKIIAEQTKKLKKQAMSLQDKLDNYPVKTYSGIWKDDVTTKDWKVKQGSIQAKKQYFEGKLLYATDPADIAKWQGLLDELDDFNTQGKAYYDISDDLTQTNKDLQKLLNGGIKKGGNLDDAFTQARKDAAYWFTDANGGVAGADGVLRDVSGDVWKHASKDEKKAIYEYTRSYSKYNEPLRGIEYGTNKFLGVGNVDLNMIGVNYGGYKPGQVKKLIDDMSSIIEKSEYDFDIWVQRGCNYSGMDKFFGIDSNDFFLSEAELAAKLVGTTPTEHAFMSAGVSKGKGFASCPIILNVYAPKGTKMMYAEPFSHYGAEMHDYSGNQFGLGWNGVDKQNSFGSEAEIIFQKGTKFRVTKVEKTGSKIYIDMEVIEQGV